MLPWGLKLFAHFSKNGHTKCLHKILLLLLLHKKHKHFARQAGFRCWYAIVSECIGTWVACKPNPVQDLIESALSAQMGLPGRAELPTWLAVTQRQSPRARLSVIKNTHSHIQRNESGFGEAKLCASKLQNFHSERITPENGLGTVAWAHNCSAAAVYLLKCERLIKPRVPWWDSLITCHWDLCKW